MVGADNCLIYEFYNVVKSLASELILAEVFIKVEVVCGQLERKGKAAVSGPTTISFFMGQGEL